MLFNSIEYAVFLPIVFILFWRTPGKYRWLILLISSYIFYMGWNWRYIILIIGVTVIAYVSGLMLEKWINTYSAKKILLCSIVLNLGILFIFKYLNFFLENIVMMGSLFKSTVDISLFNIILPVGISFYIFQAMGYIIDVYKGKTTAEHHFGKFATYISFFPQLVAGPIERTENLLPQIKEERNFSYENATYGLKKIAWGFFKKIVIADTLASDVDRVYAGVNSWSGFVFLIVAVFFSIQIYCDFSGYSDIAIGTAKLFNINLMENFKSPYFASSIKEFWNRWHISLSSWFTDYVYIPLGGNRCSKFRNKVNIGVTFLLSGIWHGSAWHYVIWGGVHGIGRIIEGKKYNPQYKWIKRILVFAFCTVGWVFFRASSLSDAVYVFSHAFMGISHVSGYIMTGFSDLGIGWFKLIYLTFLLLILMVYDYISLKYDIIEKISEWPLLCRWSVYMFIGLMVVLFSWKGMPEEFIYFQF